MSTTQRTRKVGMWTGVDGGSLHDGLGQDIRRTRARGIPCPSIRFLPGTVFTDGERMYEVVYGCQGLNRDPAGWVAAVPTDWIDNGPPEGHERSCYSLFFWNGKPRDSVIIGGKRRPFILRLVAPAPRLGASV